MVVQAVLSANTISKIEIRRDDCREELERILGGSEAVDAMQASVTAQESASWGEWVASTRVGSYFSR